MGGVRRVLRLGETRGAGLRGVALAAFATALLWTEAAFEETGSPWPFVLATAIGGALAFGRRFPLGAYFVSSVALELMAAFYYDAGLYPTPNAISLFLVGAHAATRLRALVGLVVGLSG